MTPRYRLRLRAGCRLEFFGQRLFVELSVTFNCWPVNTGMPAAFGEKENKWHNYFLFQPGLNFGLCF